MNFVVTKDHEKAILDSGKASYVIVKIAVRLGWPAHIAFEIWKDFLITMKFPKSKNYARVTKQRRKRTRNKPSAFWTLSRFFFSAVKKTFLIFVRRELIKTERIFVQVGKS